MKKTTLTLLLLLFTSLCFAQDKEEEIKCGTRDMTQEEIEQFPWYNDESYLKNFLDSIKGKSSSNTLLRTQRSQNGRVFQVPVKAWVYKNTVRPDTIPTEWQISRWLNIMDSIMEMNDVPIRFYLLCNPEYVTNNNYYNGYGFEGMIAANHTPNVYNLHFVRDAFYIAQSTFTNEDTPHSTAIRTRRNPAIIGESDYEMDLQAQREFAVDILHEFGHVLNLQHTHRGYFSLSNSESPACRQEYVDRERRVGLLCLLNDPGAYAAHKNGDTFRDTQADPDLEFKWVDNNCNYSPTRIINGQTQSIAEPKDKDGHTWQPDTKNLMSYSRSRCKINENAITYSQQAAMLIYVPQVAKPADIDEYENDNFYQVANFVDIGRFPRQHHTFHNNWGGATSSDPCDEDWLQFTVSPTINKVIVVTRPAPAGKPTADTYLTLYRQQIVNGNITLTIIATDDNGSQYGTGYSRIEKENLPSGTYYVKVSNKTKFEGHYVIGIFPERENWGSYPRGSGGGGTGGDADGEIDFGVDDPTFGGDIDGNGTLDYVCDGAQLNLQGLDNDPNWSVQWSTNNPSVTAINGLIQTNGFSGEVMITALIYYNGALVGNAVRTIWVGVPEAPTLVVGNIRGEGNTLCQGEPIYLSTANSVRGFATGYRWQLYKNGVQIFDQTTPTPELYIDRLVLNVPIGYYQAYVSACNTCGCTRSNAVTLEVIPNTDQRCRSIGGGRGKIQVNSIIENEISIYPNPVSNQLTIKLPTLYNENPTQVELYNSIGQLVYSKTYTETSIEFSVSSFPKGLYILKIQNGEEMKTEKIIIE